MMTSVHALEEQIAAQGNRVRQLKFEKAEATVVEPEIATLKDLKSQLAALRPPDPAAAPPKDPGARAKGKGRETAPALQLKVPKGTKDHLPHEMFLRKQLFTIITNVFEMHGGVTIDTPVFELKEILTGKYGEDSKLIYDLQDQGGELCSLRYDLTVPFARFLAMNGKQYQNIKRYHIAKVYRRDNPAMTKGRLREFYQCDFDIAGTYDPMIPDAEIVVLTTQVLEGLRIGEFTIKINHRKLLDGIFEISGVPEEKIRSISSAVDKLDKLPWEEVRKEMIEEKGLEGDVADRIGHFVKLKGGPSLLEQLKLNGDLAKSQRAQEALGDMQLFFDYVAAFGCDRRLSFDLSLARGLDYYTGVIFEAVTEASAPPSMSNGRPHADLATKKLATKGEADDVDESQVGVGSIAGGGRYDNLVGMFSASGGQIPCVGISFGVERIFAIMQRSAADLRAKETDVLIMNMNNKDGQIKERMEVARLLWDAGIKAEFIYKVKPRADTQWSVLQRDAIPIAIFIGGREWSEGKVRVKEQVGKDASKGEGDEVAKVDLVGDVRRRLKILRVS